ncbi:MAG: 16S rRNA (guanine(527)-N(7))-methyltransferase RsmG [Thermoanaerobaculia bacterium]
MAVLPAIELAPFARRLRQLAGEELPEEGLRAVHAHYEELRRWAPTVALIGPGAVDELLERHYAESLAALPLLPPGAATVLDVGSGAGFPGLVLAALRPDLSFVLTEARERKWAFLQAACRKAGLSCRCLNVRVAPKSADELPESIAVLTSRAVRIDLPAWEALTPRLAPGAQALFWCGEERPELPPAFREGRAIRLSGARRWIREYCWQGSG